MSNSVYFTCFSLRHIEREYQVLKEEAPRLRGEVDKLKKVQLGQKWLPVIILCLSSSETYKRFDKINLVISQLFFMKKISGILIE